MGEAKRRRAAADRAGRIFTAKDGSFIWNNTRHSTTPCPFCDAPLDAATSPEGYTPFPGCWTVCLVCTQLLIFTDDMRLREATPAELKWMDEYDPGFGNKLRAFQRAARQVDRRDIPRYG